MKENKSDEVSWGSGEKTQESYTRLIDYIMKLEMLVSIGASLIAKKLLGASLLIAYVRLKMDHLIYAH